GIGVGEVTGGGQGAAVAGVDVVALGGGGARAVGGRVREDRIVQVHSRGAGDEDARSTPRPEVVRHCDAVEIDSGRGRIDRAAGGVSAVARDGAVGEGISRGGCINAAAETVGAGAVNVVGAHGAAGERELSGVHVDAATVPRCGVVAVDHAVGQNRGRDCDAY